MPVATPQNILKLKKLGFDVAVESGAGAGIEASDADLLGRRRLFLAGLGVFTAASFASAMAGTAGALFAARAGQGLGAAMLSPAALAIIMSAFHGEQRAKALALFGRGGSEPGAKRPAKR